MKKLVMGQPYSLRLASWVMLSQLTLMVVIIRAGADSKNGSSGGLFWSAAKEEQDLLQEAEPKDDSTSSTLVNDVDEVDGGFSSLDGMLQWAIGWFSFPLLLFITKTTTNFFF